MQIDQSRHRRHAARNNVNGIVEPSKKFYPPKPPKDLPTPGKNYKNKLLYPSINIITE